MTALLIIVGYLFMAGVASFVRALVIEKPKCSIGASDWAAGNAVLPMIWPAYLPILAGFAAGKFAKKIHAMLNEEAGQ